MLKCKCMDVHHSGERTSSGPMKGATGSKEVKGISRDVKYVTKGLVASGHGLPTAVAEGWHPLK